MTGNNLAETDVQYFPNATGSRGLVLVANSAEEICYPLGVDLNRVGFAVITTQRGTTAVELAIKHTPAVALIGFMLPGLRGLEVGRQIRQQETLQDLILVAATACDPSTHHQEALEVGFDHFMSMPVDLERLVALMDLVRPVANVPPVTAVRRLLLKNAAQEFQAHDDSGQALLLWNRVDAIKPLDDCETLNRLICLYRLGRGVEFLSVISQLVQRTAQTPIIEQCLILAMLCHEAANEWDRAKAFGLMLAQRIVNGAVEDNTNVWDVAGEPTVVSPDGRVLERKSGEAVIGCAQTCLKLASNSSELFLLQHLLGRQKARHQAMFGPPPFPKPENQIKAGKLLWW